MNAFQVAQKFTSQGADAGHMARVLESLTMAGLLPTWGEGKVGEVLSEREVASIIMGATAADAGQAAEHVVTVSQLIRGDGLSLGEILVKRLSGDPSKLVIEEMVIAQNGTAAVMRYTSIKKTDYFFAGDGVKAVYTGAVIRGSVLGSISTVMKHPTKCGWVAEPVAKL